MIRALINLYILLIIVDVILSYLPQFKTQPWAVFIKKAADFSCKPIRKLLPPDLPFDFSGFIVIIGLKVFMGVFMILW